MCTGLEPWMLAGIATAAGSGIQAVNQHQALKRQDAETARGITARSALQREAGQRVQQQINDVAASNPETERKAANDQFMAALRNAKAADGGADLTAVPGGSERFAADVGQARAAAGREGAALSGQLAAIDAPMLQRQREARGFTNAATDLSMIGDRSNSLDFLTQLRTAQAGRTNPWADALGQGLQAFGSAYAGRARPVKGPALTHEGFHGGFGG